MRVARDLEHGLEPKVEFDVRVLNHAPVYFQYEVTGKGILVLERDREGRVDFEAHLITEYLDLKYMYPTFRTFSSPRNNFRTRSPTTLEL
jgi:hypothetical protein